MKTETFRTYCAIDDFVAAKNLPPESSESLFVALRDILPFCESQEEIEKHLSDWLVQRPHLYFAGGLK